MKIKGCSLYYEVYGKGDPLLLIAGLAADSASWAGVCAKLAKHFRVIVFDNRASGRSGVPKGKYSIRKMADDAAGLLDSLKIKRCHVLGHSMGGYIAQVLAAYYPERIDRLILEATAFVSSARNNVLFSDFLRQLKNDRDNERFMRSWTYWLFSPKTFERKNYVETFIKNASAYPYLQSVQGFKAQIVAIASFNGCTRIKDIKAKTLVIAGSDDILIYPKESRQLLKEIKGSVFEEIEDAGHCLHVERPDVFTSKVIRFLR